MSILRSIFRRRKSIATETVETFVDWDAIFEEVRTLLDVESAMGVNQLATVWLDSFQSSTPQFELLWEDRKKLLPLSDFEFLERDNWKIYYIKGKVVFLFFNGTVGTPFCFIKADFDEL